MTVEQLIKVINSSTQHRSLYHFTDQSNLESIRAHGLLSKAKLREREFWPPPAPGGNKLSWDLDLHRGIDASVSLCMTQNHGMCYLAKQDGRLPNPRYLKISTEVLAIDGVRIALGVANANDTEILSVADAVNRMDTEVLYTRTNWKDAAVHARLSVAEKYEVLVPDEVPRKFIIGIC